MSMLHTRIDVYVIQDINESIIDKVADIEVRAIERDESVLSLDISRCPGKDAIITAVVSI